MPDHIGDLSRRQNGQNQKPYRAGGKKCNVEFGRRRNSDNDRVAGSQSKIFQKAGGIIHFVEKLRIVQFSFLADDSRLTGSKPRLFS